MGTTKRNILVIITIMLVAAIAVGAYLYNKEGPNVAGAKAVKISAGALYQSFIKDSVAAKNLYLQNILSVSGEVTAVSVNQQQQAVILLKTATAGASVNCTLEGTATNIHKGNLVAIKGICNGLGQGDADMGLAPDVYLLRCYLVSKE